MRTYDIDADGYLLGEANPDRGFPGPIVIPPPLDAIPPDRCHWSGSAWEDVARPDDRSALYAQAEAAVQARLDAQAQAWGYDDVYTAVSYADEPADARFQAEGQALRAWRSLTWRRCWDLADSVASIDDLLAQLPAAPERPTVGA